MWGSEKRCAIKARRVASFLLTSGEDGGDPMNADDVGGIFNTKKATVYNDVSMVNGSQRLKRLARQIADSLNGDSTSSAKVKSAKTAVANGSHGYEEVLAELSVYLMCGSGRGKEDVAEALGISEDAVCRAFGRVSLSSERGKIDRLLAELKKGFK